MLPFNTFLILSVILLSNQFSESTDVALKLAEKFFDSGDYYNALTEYKRFIFFNRQPNNDIVSHAYYKIGLSYRNQKKRDECIEAFQKSIQTAVKEITRDERKIALAVALISVGDYSAAEFLLVKLEMFTHFPEIRRKATFFRGISALFCYKWQEIREAFSLYFRNTNSNSQEIFEQIDSLLAKAQDFKYKSPKLAKILSTILPGSGQIYAGDWHNGINGLLVSSAAGYLLASDLINQKYLEIILNSLFLFIRFYNGNRFIAEKSTLEYNHQIKKQVTKKILEILEINKNSLNIKDDNKKK